MSDRSPLLEIRFDGEAVGPAKIPVSHLLRFLSGLKRTLQRVGRVLQGDTESLCKGRPPQSIRREVELDLVSLKEGSPAAVLGFDRTEVEPRLLGMDFGYEILERALSGLKAVQGNESDEALPTGYDPGVLMAWCDAGTVFGRGIEKVTFTLNGPEMAMRTSFTPNGANRIRNRIREPQVRIRTIEGRLLMADFKEFGTRCRVHPSVGDPIICLFHDTQKDQVQENLMRHVRVVGEAHENPTSGKIVSITIHDIEPLAAWGKDDAGLLPQGTAVSHTFWGSPTLEELAHSQRVGQLDDVRSLFGTWPGEIEDGFEAAIDELRHPHAARSGR